MTVQGTAEAGAVRTSGWAWLLLALVAPLPLFWFGFEGLAQEWARPEYRFKIAVPALALVMFLQVLRGLPPAGQGAPLRWPGVVLVVGALMMALLGNLMSVDDFVFVAMILWVIGLVVVWFGLRRSLHFWAPMASLFLMLPLPRFVYAPIHAVFERIAAEIGIAVAGIIGAPGRIEGQLIHFGGWEVRLSLAAASLVHFLPVMLIFFFFATLRRGPLWGRLMPLLLTVPVVILLTAFRIAVTGVVALRAGPEAAERFLALSEGWLFLVASVGVLMLPFAIGRLMRGGGAAAGALAPTGLRTALGGIGVLRPSSAFVGAVLLTAAVSGAYALAPPRPAPEIQREAFQLFPPDIGDWSGSAMAIDPATERVLGADDYVLMDYFHRDERAPVNFWSAYYYRQEGDKGGIHSPQDCLPLDGWNIVSFRPVELSEGGASMTVNRAVIAKGEARAMVYYWFEGRGRSIANERLARLMVKVDSLIKGRTDGALVRFVTPILEGEAEAEAEARILRLMEPTLPQVRRFVPA